MTNKVDFTKPVRFVAGRCNSHRKIERIVAHDLPGEFSVCAVCVKNDGSLFSDTFEAGAFENIPPEPIVRYINVYDDFEDSFAHETRELADQATAKSRTRIACVRVTEGQFDE